MCINQSTFENEIYLGILQKVCLIKIAANFSICNKPSFRLSKNSELNFHSHFIAHYPPSNVEGLGISDHTDWELFTLLYPSFYPIQHNAPCYTGLEVWFENHWVSTCIYVFLTYTKICQNCNFLLNCSRSLYSLKSNSDILQ